MKVLARAEPSDKKLVIAGLKAQAIANKIAIVGDDINDVESFKDAHVSFSMHNSHSILKNNASMVLKDDNFESCMRAVMWGRNVYSNIKRFL